MSPASLPPGALVAAAGTLLEHAIAGEVGALAATFAQTTLVVGSAQTEVSINRAACEPSPMRYEMLSITGISGWITACRPPTPRTVRCPMLNSSPTCTAFHGPPSCSAVCGSAYSAACGLASISAGSRSVSA